MNDNKIIEFLCEAKKKTYAGKGAESTSSRPMSHDLIYEQGNLKYIDTYLGSRIFSGEEALWIDDKPYWSMNYIGRVTDKDFSGDFLKEALLSVPEEYPFRGPKLFVKNDYEYIMDYEGDFDWFSGKEEIFYKGKLVYDCLFHGARLEE